MIILNFSLFKLKIFSLKFFKWVMLSIGESLLAGQVVCGKHRKRYCFLIKSENTKNFDIVN